MDKILRAMTLAPSAHNTQPWKFKKENSSIKVIADTDRHLEVSDPTQRQLFVGLGCAIANAIVAAAKQGLVTTVNYIENGAELSFASGSPDEHKAKLYEAIASRRTDRTIYDGEPLTQSERSALRSTYDADAMLVQDRGIIDQLAELTGQGSWNSLSRKDFKEELSHWVRSNWTKKPDGMPGYAMQMPAPMSLISSWLVKVAPIHKQEQTNTKKQMASASAVLVVLAEYDDSESWMKAGQLLEQAWLEAVSAGLAAAPLAAVIEAGAEIRQQARDLLDTNKLPQVVLRLGHSSQKNLKASPRRSVEDCLVE